MKVAIVGSGAAGLCALRHLTCQHQALVLRSSITAIAFEQTEKLGGTWVYTDHVGKDDNGLPIHSSMYANMKTNLPKQCMAFPDFQFPTGLPSYVHHYDVLNYLENYASHFDLRKHIKFQTKVDMIMPIESNENKFGVLWEVTTSNVPNPEDRQTEMYDAVLVCNGHYAVPMVPELPGLDSFTGKQIHSHNYRVPAPFKDERVVLLGAAASGQDISLEISTVAKQVFLSHNKSPLQCPLPSNMEQRVGIQKISGSEITFVDGSTAIIDSIIFCTGYHYDFSFLAPECGVIVNDGRVTPLYKHFIHTKFPTLGFVGICKTIVPFPMFDIQIRFFKALLENSFTLPSEEEMNEDTETEYFELRKSGFLHRYAHVLSDKQFAYNNELADIAGISRNSIMIEKLYKAAHIMRRENLMGYKKVNFSVDSTGDCYTFTKENSVI